MIISSVNLDRLTGVTYFDTLVDTFAMDDLGNRTGSETQRNTAHTYAVDSLTNRYTAIDEVLRMRADESDYYYLHDHLYSPAVLIGYESGQWRPVERYEYDAYGTARVINRGPDNAWFTADDVVTGSSAINTTLFTGRTLDALDSGPQNHVLSSPIL